MQPTPDSQHLRESVKMALFDVQFELLVPGILSEVIHVQIAAEQDCAIVSFHTFQPKGWFIHEK